MKRFLIIPSCGEVHEGITEFTERALPWHQRLGYRLHFLLCAGCRKLLAEFAALPGRLRRALSPAEGPPAEAVEALDSVLRHLKKGGPGPQA